MFSSRAAISDWLLYFYFQIYFFLSFMVVSLQEQHIVVMPKDRLDFEIFLENEFIVLSIFIWLEVINIILFATKELQV